MLQRRDQPGSLKPRGDPGGSFDAQAPLFIRNVSQAPGLWMSFAAVCGLVATLALYGRRSEAPPKPVPVPAA